ncbi:hypothetical protein ACBJ59_29895 [Nonomuraea sp. MTCD27]
MTAGVRPEGTAAPVTRDPFHAEKPDVVGVPTMWTRTSGHNSQATVPP